MSGTVFISHSSKDIADVELVRRLVSAQGLRVYLAEHDPQPGKHLPDKIRSNILAADAVLVLLTKASIDSRYVHQEIGVAQAARRLIVPLVHPDLVGEDLAMLNGAEFLVFDPANPAGTTPDLVGQLKRIADKAAVRDAAEALLVAALVVGVMYVALKDGGGGAAG
ncbi:MAG TPA: toll/interleukin-1 receptor domain-containing protein [Acidimicrobiales bacterium]|nr:toll/interleukin-1 receptor domain-containing protein [Acidimicrobiales bacterium]